MVQEATFLKFMFRIMVKTTWKTVMMKFNYELASKMAPGSAKLGSIGRKRELSLCFSMMINPLRLFIKMRMAKTTTKLEVMIIMDYKYQISQY